MTAQNMNDSATLTRTVALVIYPGFKAIEAAGPLSVMEYTNRHLSQDGIGGGYDVSLVSATPGSVRSDTLMSLEAGPLPRDPSAFDTVFVVGAQDIEGALQRESALVDWCQQHASKPRRFAALCTGSFLLAQAGILDGKRAATHWKYANLLRSRFPAVSVDENSIFLQDGSIWTSAGVTAAIDLALAFVEQDFGREIALRVACDMVVYLKRPGGQSQFSTVLNSQMGGSATLQDVQTWMSTRLDQPMTLGDMAERANMSIRNFSRAFAAEFNVTPVTHLELLRCERAKMLLLDTDLPMKNIAFKAGFKTDERMRKVFQRRFSLSPRDYRSRFKTTSPVA